MASISNKRDSKENSIEEYSFIYGDEAVTYEVIRKIVAEGKKKKITIRVHPDCRIAVTAPEDAEKSAIHEAVMHQARWIWDALKEFRSHLEDVQTKHYVSGEMQFYLGRRYVLKVVEDRDAISNVKMDRGKLLVTLNRFNDDKPKLVKALVSGWYGIKAERVFHQRLVELLPQATWVKGIPSFRIMPMRKQWGSCSAKGTLMLNPHLINTLFRCFD